MAKIIPFPGKIFKVAEIFIDSNTFVNIPPQFNVANFLLAFDHPDELESMGWSGLRVVFKKGEKKNIVKQLTLLSQKLTSFGIKQKEAEKMFL